MLIFRRRVKNSLTPGSLSHETWPTYVTHKLQSTTLHMIPLRLQWPTFRNHVAVFMPARINFVKIKDIRIGAAAAHPSERVIRATKAIVRSSEISLQRRPPRDPSGLLHVARVYVRLRVLKKRRQPDMKQMKCKLSEARRETLEIRSDEPGRAPSVSKLVQTWGATWYSCGKRRVLEAAILSSLLWGTGRPSQMRSVLRLIFDEGTDPNWLGRETRHGKRKRIHRRFRSCGESVQVKGITFCSVIWWYKRTRISKCSAHLFFPQRRTYPNESFIILFISSEYQYFFCVKYRLQWKILILKIDQIQEIF